MPHPGTSRMTKGLPAATGGGCAAPSAALLSGMSRPRLLVAGPPGGGQQQLAGAVLAALEGLPVHGIGLPSLLAGSGGSRWACVCVAFCCYVDACVKRCLRLQHWWAHVALTSTSLVLQHVITTIITYTKAQMRSHVSALYSRLCSPHTHCVMDSSSWIVHRSVEEALVSAFAEARRAAPAVLFWPQVGPLCIVCPVKSPPLHHPKHALSINCHAALLTASLPLRALPPHL